jgi:hypothetical protein
MGMGTMSGLDRCGLGWSGTSFLAKLADGFFHPFSGVGVQLLYPDDECEDLQGASNQWLTDASIAHS